VRIPTPEESQRFVPPPPDAPTLREAMAFAGGAPELINCRLAMLGFTHGAVAEAATGKTLGALFWSHPGTVLLWVALVAVGTLVPVLGGVRDEAFGPLSPEAERLNGRAACVGFAALALLEWSTGRAFF